MAAPRFSRGEVLTADKLGLMADAVDGAGSFLASGDGAVARAVADRLRDTVSVRDYGAAGNGSTDDTAAFTRALATGQSVYVPPGNYKLTSTITLTTSGQRLIGAGPWLSVLEWAGGNTNAVVLEDDQFMAIRSLMIRPLAGTAALSSGYAIATAHTAANPFNAEISDVMIYGMYNGVLLRSVTEAIGRDLILWGLTGAYGIRFDGTSAAPSYAATLDNVRFGGMAANTSIVLIDQNSYGYSLRMDKCILLYGGTGFRMADDLNTGTSYPMWCIGGGNECDHNDDFGVDLSAGEGFSWGTSWIGSTLNGPGLRTGTAWRGEATLSGTRVMGCKQHGITLGGGVDTVINGCVIGDCSVGSSGTYHGVNVAAGVVRFNIIGNRIGDVVGVAGNAMGYGVRIATGASDYYNVTGNLLGGNVTGGVSDGGTGINKLVQGVGAAFDKLQVGDALHYVGMSGSDPLWSVDAGDFMSYSRSGNAFGFAIGSTSVAQFRGNGPVFPTLPTSASGLPSGALWRDASASNVVKAVP